MLDLKQLGQHTTTLASGDGSSLWDAARSLKAAEPGDWEAAPPAAVVALLEALRQHLPRSGDPGTKRPPLHFRQDVVAVLGTLGPRAAPAVGQLLELLADSEAQGVREAAATALGRIGKDAAPAVDKLVAMLEANCRPPLAVRVARALGEIGKSDEKTRTALVRLWLQSVSCAKTRAQVSIALCRLKCHPAGLLSGLTSALVANPTASLRAAAAEALTWCSKNDPDVVPALTAALHDADDEVRRLATAALTRQRLSVERALDLCAQQLKDSPHAETALRRAGAQAVPVLIEAMKSSDPCVRQRAARTLGTVGEEAASAAPVLTKALRDRHSDVRLAAAKALWSITQKAEAAVPALAGLLTGAHTGLEDADARRRFLQSVIEALGGIGPPARAAVPGLLGLTTDDNRLVRESAIRSLRQIDPAATGTAV